MASFAIRRATDDIRRSVDTRKIWFFLALDDIFARYRNTVLGPLWNAAYIIAQALALSLVFSIVFHQPLKIMLPYILSGMVAWVLGPANILECAGLLIWFGGTIKTQNFPFLFYALRVVARAGLMFLHNLVALVLIMPLFGHLPLINLTIVPAVLLIMTLSVPYCLMMGMLCARFRDMQMLVTNFAGVFFLMTPIVWLSSAVSGSKSAQVIGFNPFYYMVDLIREPLLNFLPSTNDWLVCGGIALIGWLLCVLCLAAFRPRIPFWI
jgi:ABC-type polysaccharide/polyol phosphate export permease